MRPCDLIRILRLIVTHPLTRGNRWRALARFLGWQVGIRFLPGPVAVTFVNSSRLLVSRGMHGATGNVYTGLQEFEDMAFIIHLLRENDLFIDVGANIGSFTILASAVAGARSIALEPVPETLELLRDNVNLNRVQELVRCIDCGASGAPGVVKFTSSLGAENHVVIGEGGGPDIIEVTVDTLDDIVGPLAPTAIKIDVDGYETEVISGAKNILQQRSLLAVVMEMNGSGERFGFDEAALHGRMIDLGFNPYCYAPFNRELLPPASGRASSTDNTIYVRDPAPVIERIRTASRFSVNDLWV